MKRINKADYEERKAGVTFINKNIDQLIDVVNEIIDELDRRDKDEKRTTSKKRSST